MSWYAINVTHIDCEHLAWGFNLSSHLSIYKTVNWYLSTQSLFKHINW